MPKTHKYHLTGLMLEFWRIQDEYNQKRAQRPFYTLGHMVRVARQVLQEAKERQESESNIPTPWAQDE